MTDHWKELLSEPVTVRKDGMPHILNTLDDARGLLTAYEPNASEAEFCKAASTAVEKAAASGQPSDVSLATEQLKLLVRSLGWDKAQ